LIIAKLAFYEIVILYIFQKGVVIIDSPGIGESEIMDRIVTQYLPQAFAFIYVINSVNAGGVQKDRVSSVELGSEKRCFPSFV